MDQIASPQRSDEDHQCSERVGINKKSAQEDAIKAGRAETQQYPYGYEPNNCAGQTSSIVKRDDPTDALRTYGRDKACLLKHSVGIHLGLAIQLNDLSRFEGRGR